MTIQPFAPSETAYRALADIERAVWPDNPKTIPGLIYTDRTRNPDFLYRRLVTEVDGEMVGVGSYQKTPWSYRSGKYQVYLIVHPAYRRRGIGTALYQRISASLDACDPVPDTLIGFSREDMTDGVRFCERRGFSVVMRWPHMYLDVPSFRALPAAAGTAPDHEIVIRSFTDLRQRDPDYAGKIHELEWLSGFDEPSPDALTKEPVSHYDRRVLSHPDVLPDAWFIALDGDRYVGLTRSNRNGDYPRLLNLGFTGVLPEYRRRGIATALKLRVISFAASQNVRTIVTNNEENNPIFNLNRALGFEPGPAGLAFRKTPAG